MPNEPLILPALSLSEPGAGVHGAGLVIQNWRAAGLAEMVAPLHVHHADDEAWHVISGALRFRLADRSSPPRPARPCWCPRAWRTPSGTPGPSRRGTC